MRITLRASTYKRAEFRGSVPDSGQERLVQRTDCLVDSIVIGGAFHVTRELTSKAGDQHYDFTLGIIGGGRRELANLRFRFFQQILQFNRELRQPEVR